MNAMNRPYIICHMMQSLDGRVACDMVDKISGDEYYTALEILGCPSHLEGKRSYQIHYCGFEEFKPSAAGSPALSFTASNFQPQVWQPGGLQTRQ